MHLCMRVFMCWLLASVPVLEAVPCRGTEGTNGELCSFQDVDECSEIYVKVRGNSIQCGVLGSNCLSKGPKCTPPYCSVYEWNKYAGTAVSAYPPDPPGHPYIRTDGSDEPYPGQKDASYSGGDFSACVQGCDELGRKCVAFQTYAGGCSFFGPKLRKLDANPHGANIYVKDLHSSQLTGSVPAAQSPEFCRNPKPYCSYNQWRKYAGTAVSAYPPNPPGHPYIRTDGSDEPYPGQKDASYSGGDFSACVQGCDELGRKCVAFQTYAGGCSFFGPKLRKLDANPHGANIYVKDLHSAQLTGSVPGAQSPEFCRETGTYCSSDKWLKYAGTAVSAYPPDPPGHPYIRTDGSDEPYPGQKDASYSGGDFSACVQGCDELGHKCVAFQTYAGGCSFFGPKLRKLDANPYGANIYVKYLHSSQLTGSIPGAQSPEFCR